MDLIQLGWRPEFESAFRPLAQDGMEAARVATQHRRGYRVYSERGELAAEIMGRFRHEAQTSGDLPAVGDWVVIEPLRQEAKAVIHAVLPRLTKFSRTAPGGSEEEQVLAANIDDAVIVAAFGTSPNLRRIERYVAVAWESGAEPIVVLSKADLCPNVDDVVQQVASVARGAPVYAVSNETGQGLAELDVCLRPGRTLALLGPSGVGKSTLINRWCGEDRLDIQPVRASDQKGRHTTTRRELILLPGGALVIDTPGMRELQLWEGSEGVEETFADVTQLALGCRFADCRHETEPDCAVRLALQDGRLDASRFLSHQKLKLELEYLEQRHDKRSQAAARQRVRAIHKQLRAISKRPGREGR